MPGPISQANTRFEERIRAQASAPSQLTHPAASTGATVKAWVMPALLGTSVAAVAGLVTMKLAAPRIKSARGIALMAAVPVGVLAATTAAAGLAMNRSIGAQNAEPLPAPRAVTMGADAPGDTTLIGDEVGTVSGYGVEAEASGDAVAAPYQTFPLTVGDQLGRIEGYDSVDEAVRDVAGNGNAVVIEDGGAFRAYTVQDSSVASNVLTNERPLITPEGTSLAAVIRNGSELFVAGTDSFVLAGGISLGDEADEYVAQRTAEGESDAMGALADSVADDIDDMELATFDQPGAKNGSVQSTGVVGLALGYSDRADALGAMLLARGDQAVVENFLGRFSVVNVEGDANAGARLRGMKVGSDELVALEHKDIVYSPASGRLVRASFDQAHE